MKRDLIFGIVICFFCVNLVSCGKKVPAEMKFYNVINFDYITKKNRSENQELCKNGISNKPGVIFSFSLEKPIGASKVTKQIIDNNDGSVIFVKESNIDPELKQIQTAHNFEKKGKYKVNILVKDEIVAQGTIEYK